MYLLLLNFVSLRSSVCVQWHALGRAEQAKYYEMARKEKELHMQLHPGWSARDNYATHTKKKKKLKRDVIAQQQQQQQAMPPHSDTGLPSFRVKDDPGCCCCCCRGTVAVVTTSFMRL